MITIKNKEPKCINLCIFFIFVCLTLGELYKLYFDSFCSYQSFTIKKIVTTHPYLNQNDFEQNYENKLLQYRKGELKSKQERNLEISYQTGYSVIKGIVKDIKDIKPIISHDIKEFNIDKQINIEIINEIKEQKNNSDFNNEYNNNNIYDKDNNGKDSSIIVNNNIIYNIDNNESFSVIFVNNKNIHNKDNNESEFINLIKKKFF